QIAAGFPEAIGFCLVAGGLPRPVRSIEVHADEERLGRFCGGLDDLNGAFAEEFGEVAVLMDGGIIVPEVFLAVGLMRVVVESAAAEPVEVVVPALEGAVLG